VTLLMRVIQIVITNPTA